jgi:hypothetical protein
VVESVHARAPGARYPKQYLLDKLRAGRPVTVTAGELPVEHGGTPKPRTRVEANARTDVELAAAAAVLVLHLDGRVMPASPGDVDPIDVFHEYRNLQQAWLRPHLTVGGWVIGRRRR